MEDLEKILKEHKGKVLLAVFAHPNDESFLTGGLLQKAHEAGVFVSLLCLTKGEKGQNKVKHKALKEVRTKELERASSILSIDNCIVWNYTDTNLHNESKSWAQRLEEEIARIKPSILVTFDHSGMTGHPDHITICTQVIKLLNELKNSRPLVFLCVPDTEDKKHFKNNKAMPLANIKTHRLSFGLKQAIKKIKAIYAHKSQMPGFLYKLYVLDRYLFNHHEFYHVIPSNMNLHHIKRVSFIHV